MTTHLRDTRRPEGSAVTKGGRIRQIPVICALDLLEVTDGLDVLSNRDKHAGQMAYAGNVQAGTASALDWFTDEPELVDCDDCRERIDAAIATVGEGFTRTIQGIADGTYTLTHAGDRCERAIELLKKVAATRAGEAIVYQLRTEINALLAEVGS